MAARHDFVEPCMCGQLFFNVTSFLAHVEVCDGTPSEAQAHREAPRGWPGYPSYTRHNALSTIFIASVSERANLEHVHRSTVYRWDAALRSEERAGPLPHGGGRQRKLSEEGAYCLAWLKLVFPQARLDECVEFVGVVTGEETTQPQVSRELRVMGFSRKVVHYKSCHRDEDRRVQWWTNAPPRGIFGVPTCCIVCLDECGVWLSASNRGRGHSLVGRPAIATGHPRRGGTK